MGIRSEERGQSIQLGAIMLFGMLVILFSVYQAFIIPQQNAEIESNHLQTTDQQMQDLRNTIVSLPGTGSDKSVTLTLGTTYSARVIAMNPGPPTGALRTVETQNERINLTLANAVATDSEVDDFWDGTDRSYNTGGLVYAPNYNVYENAPEFIYENTLLSKHFRSGNLTVSGQKLVDGKRLTLITLNGSYDKASRDSAALDVEAVSASTTTVSLTNETGANVTVRVASRRNASAWRDVLEDDEQFTDQGGHVLEVTETSLPHPTFDRIEVELEGNVTYKLRMAKAGVGTQITDETEAYLTDVQGNGTSIQENTTTDLVVEVRDEFNNPVTDVTVNAKIENALQSGTITPKEVTTDADGEAVFDYQSASIDGVSSRSIDVNFSIAGQPDSGFDPGTAENVTMDVTVQNTDSSGTTSGSSSSSGDVGTAETSDYNTLKDTRLRTSGGTWLNISGAKSINLSDPKFSPFRADNGDWDEHKEYFRIVFGVENDTYRYIFLFSDGSEGVSYKFDNQDLSNNKVTILKRELGTSTKYEKYIDGNELDADKIAKWHDNETEIDILASSTWKGTSESKFDEIERLLTDPNNDDPAELFIFEMSGRTDMNLTATDNT